MSTHSKTPYYQWLVPGCLNDVIEKLGDWQEPQVAGFEILSVEEEGSKKDLTFCLNHHQWGEFGLIHLSYVDRGQTLLVLYRSSYPTQPETVALEPQIRASVSQPAAALRLLDMYGPEKTLPYLAARLHEQRSFLLESARISLAHNFGGATVSPIPIDEQELHIPSSPATENPSNPPYIPTARHPRKRDIPRTNGMDSEMLRQWSDGLSIKQIATQMGKTEKTIVNRLSLLRKTLGEQDVPRRR